MGVEVICIYIKFCLRSSLSLKDVACFRYSFRFVRFWVPAFPQDKLEHEKVMCSIKNGAAIAPYQGAAELCNNLAKSLPIFKILALLNTENVEQTCENFSNLC